MDTEGASYYWMYKQIHNFAQWVGCAATNVSQTMSRGTPRTGNTTQDWLVPAGWTVYSTIWQPDGSEAEGLYWPFATVIYKGDSVVVLIRCV